MGPHVQTVGLHVIELNRLPAMISMNIILAGIHITIRAPSSAD
jgi:hypothetical protein